MSEQATIELSNIYASVPNLLGEGMRRLCLHSVDPCMPQDAATASRVSERERAQPIIGARKGEAALIEPKLRCAPC